MAERRGNLVTILIALAVRAVTIGLLMVWLLLESPVAMRVSTDDQRGEDRGTLLFNAVSRGLAVAAALALPSVWTRWNFSQTVGLVLFVAGFGFRLAAIRQLGRFYSHKVRRAEGHEIIDQGPYRGRAPPRLPGGDRGASRLRPGVSQSLERPGRGDPGKSPPSCGASTSRNRC